MIESFFSTVKTAAILIAIAIAIVFVIVVVMKGKEHIDDTERKRKDKEEIEESVRTIKTEIKKWDKKLKLNYLEYFAEEYNKLEECKHKPVGAGYSTQTVIMVVINNELKYFSVDLPALDELYRYLKQYI